MEGIDQHLNINKVLNAFLWGVLIAIGYMVVRMGVDMFVGDTIGQIKAVGILDINLLAYLDHRAYIGMTLLMSIPIILERTNRRKRKIAYFLFAFIVLLVCFMSGARIIMGLVFLIPVIEAYILWGNKFKLWIKITLLFIVLLSGLIITMTNSRVMGKINQLSAGVDIHKIESRTFIWDASVDLIKEKVLFGYGIGDMENVLISEYLKRGQNKAFERKLNCHNQYLQIILGGGFIALLLLILFFISLFFVSETKKYIVFVIIFGFVAVFESILIRNIGIFPLVFFCFNLYLLNENKSVIYERIKSNTYPFFDTFLPYILIFILFVLSSIGLGSKMIRPKTNRPNTYIMRGASYIVNEKLPGNISTITTCDGAMIDFKNKGLWVGDRNNKRYVRNDFLTIDLSEYKNVNINFSLWCYVPSYSKLNVVKIGYTDNKTTDSNSFDFELNKWMKLSIDQSRTMGNTRFYFLTECDNHDFENSNVVYFTSPELIINGKCYICKK